jgi:hypothetical protein
MIVLSQGFITDEEEEEEEDSRLGQKMFWLKVS